MLKLTVSELRAVIGALGVGKTKVKEALDEIIEISKARNSNLHNGLCLKVCKLLRDEVYQTSIDIAAACDRSPATLRCNLNYLRKNGYIKEAGTEINSGTKPVIIWTLTDEGELYIMRKESEADKQRTRKRRARGGQVRRQW